MRKAFAIVVLALGLAACDAVDTAVDGFKNANAVAGDLEQTTGVRPQVGFQWTNGRLVSVTVTFPLLYDAKPMRELVEAVRAAIGKEFKQKPESIVLAFALAG
jgi:hypothetical protein